DHDEPVHFFERFSPNDVIVSPKLRQLRRAHKRGPVPDNVLDESLRELLAAMLKAQQFQLREMEGLAALRVSTRQELWRRLNRARDFIHAQFETPLSLDDM